MMLNYPSVHGELETIAKIKEGFSISRVGDGELKILEGLGYSREKPNPVLTKELRVLMDKPKDRCLIGIPTMDPKGSKYKNTDPISKKVVGWHRHKDRFCKYLKPDIEYYSALITRVDCGEWMLTIEYAKALQSIWLGKKVVVVGAAGSKVLKAVETTQEAKYIECPLYGAYAVISELEKAVLASGADIALLSAGPTATCLANRLAPHMQAVDIGSIGGFLVKMLGGEKWEQ